MCQFVHWQHHVKTTDHKNYIGDVSLDKEVPIKFYKSFGKWTGPESWWLPKFSGTSESKNVYSTGVHRRTRVAVLHHWYDVCTLWATKCCQSIFHCTTLSDVNCYILIANKCCSQIHTAKILRSTVYTCVRVKAQCNNVSYKNRHSTHHQWSLSSC